MKNLNHIWYFCKEYSLLLVLGSILAIILANCLPDFYNNISHFVLFQNDFIGHKHNGHYDFTLNFLVNEIFMAVFFSIAGKEVWEAIALKNGSLRGKQAISVIIATFGGVFGPVLIFLLVLLLLGNFQEIKNGWAIPTATDIAFAYLVGRLIFGKNHPAIGFLLALAILDDALGLIILAVFYPNGQMQLSWLLLSTFVSIFSYLFFNYLPRKFRWNKYKIMLRKAGILPFIIAGCISWYAFFKAGIHPVLSFIPIIITIPHSETEGIFAEVEDKKMDLLNQFEHKLQNLIPIILGLFGFLNAGVVFSSINEATWATAIGLIIGKPLGITIFGLIAMKFLGLPKGMQKKDLPVLGAIAGIGFTVSLFVSLQAFPTGEIQDGAKMGALFSFIASIIAIILAKFLKTKKEVWKKVSAIISQTPFNFFKIFRIKFRKIFSFFKV